MSIEGLIADLGYAGFAGFVVGFAVKKLLNLFLMMVGLYFLSLFWLQNKGIIDINWAQFWVLVKSLFSGVDEFVKGALKTVAFSSAFVGGFFLGFKTG
ncbi:FUN14 domain-containing protein [Thermocrinis sp.]|uniref:FUN14 domain-containing protein n=1 Tax=Thermocrinis sp. TaxID=2024383 RepID=UPI002FDDD0F4